MAVLNRKKILKLNKNSANGIITAGQISANDMILWTLIMLPVDIILFGAGQCFVAVGLFVWNVFAWLFLARRLRGYAELTDTDIHHAGDFFLARYESKGLKYIISIIWIVILGMILSAVLQFSVEIISKHLKLNILLCTGLLVAALLIIVCIFDEKIIHFLKMIIFSAMILLFIVLIISFFSSREASDILDIYGKIRLSGGTSIYLNMMYYDGKLIEPVSLISMIGVGISCIGMPFIYKGIICVRDNKELDRSRIMAIFFVGVTIVASCILALLTVACIYPLKIDKDNNVFDVYNLIIHALYRTNRYETEIRYGILVIYMLAILILAGSLLRTIAELIRGLIPNGKNKKQNSSTMLFDICIVILLGLIMFFLIWQVDIHVQSMIKLAWNLCGSALAAPCFACIMWQKSTKAGIYCGIAGGGILYLIWSYLPVLHGASLYQETGLSGLVVAVVFSLLLIRLVSIFTKKTSEKEQQVFERMRMNQK